MLYIKTLDEMREELGVKDSEDNTLITNLLEGIQGRFDDFLERTLLRGVDVEETFDGNCRWLLPKRYPIESISTLFIDEDEISGASYRVNTTLGRILYGNGMYKWPEGFQNIKVVYTGGFAATGEPGQYAMPESIKRALSMQAGFEWRNRRNLGQQSVSGQGVNISLAPAKLLPEVQEALWSFKRF